MRPHDRGGWPIETPIDRSEHEWADWEKETAALFGLLASEGVVNLDKLRRGIESIEPLEYGELSYYERWSASIETLLTERGILTAAEIDEKTAQLDQRWG